MKKQIKTRHGRIFLLPTILILVLTACSGTESATIHELDANAVNKLIEFNKTNKNFTILDMRLPEEYNKGHLDKAVNLNIYQRDFIKQLKKLDKDRTYLLYCRSGGRSWLAATIMQEFGFKRLYNLNGGITNWTEANFPIKVEEIKEEK